MGDGKRDHWLSPLSIKPSQGLIDDQDEVRGEESMMSLVPWESTVRVFLLPVSLPVLLPIPGPTQSHLITVFYHVEGPNP